MPKAKRKHDAGKAARKLRWTIFKSGFSGVVLTCVAAVFSAHGGLDGLIGTSVAHNMPGREPDAIARGFPATPEPLSKEELRGIRSELDDSIASLDAARASTDDEIERIKALSERSSFMPVTGAPRYDDLALLLLRRG
ncbi:MAG TPA: hypothetical protein VG841_13735 [Caulobacterales bacterium]|nr:hypothetical protein [Caulobacterales bacterium]